MATAKKSAKSVSTKNAAKAAPKKIAAPAGALKPIKTALNKTSLASHLAEHTNVEPKAVKAVLTALEATILASVNKKGLGAFTLPGLLKISAQNVPAKKKRFGKDPGETLALLAAASITALLQRNPTPCAHPRPAFKSC
jgi:Bacterial DNA-binding protein